MDIQYLLFLQDFRNSINNAWTPFMEFISTFAVDYMVLIPIFFYWFVDKKKGLYALVSYYFCMFLTPVVKLTGCVYRPWIRDPRIVPAGDSIRTATGYSFPSGHVGTAAPLAGGMAVNMWKNRKTRWLSVVFVVLILLVAFSRNYLGVHTPQDVCVALILAVFNLVAASVLFDYLAKHPEKEDLFLLGGFVLCWLAILYISVKSYPIDLNAEGKPIVDPVKMMNDGYGDLGKVMGFIIGRYVEKNWIRFKPAKKDAKALILCLVGLLPVVFFKTYVRPVITDIFGSHWGKLIFSVAHVFYYIALFPLLLKLVGGKQQEARSDFAK
ncbi:MAG: phosphatase PAP2 family protein [Clostridia bacterium]|nr:phosphatase PAP2 family protein [Clostridia bacterium]